MFIPDQHQQPIREFRTIQSVGKEKDLVTREKLQSNFWGFSLFTLLLTLALLSMLNLHHQSKNKD